MASRRRSIRVFISSPFIGMGPERDAIVNDVFRRLHAICARRAVTFSGIDLRWGITEEQMRRGDLIPLLFHEIRSCRPYFLCILGDRYGSPPAAIPAEVAARHPWIRKAANRSYTEIEAQYAVLRRHQLTGRELFCFKRLPSDVFADDSRRIRRFERAVRAAGARRITYTRVTDLAAKVEDALLDFIDRDFPEDHLSAHDRGTLEQRGFEEWVSRGFLGRREALAFLDEWVERPGRPLIVSGPSGAGKSALLARWVALRRRAIASGSLDCVPPSVISYFIGSTPESANLRHILTRLIVDLAAISGAAVDLPESVPDLKRQFAMTLHQAARARRILLVLDGLDGLNGGDGARSLHWLPRTLPDGVRLIASAADPAIVSAFEDRGGEAWPLSDLSERSIRRIAHRYPKRLYGKELPEAALDRVAAKARPAGPRYLRVLLEEIRLHGDHRSLETALAGFLEAADEVDLYCRVLRRLENECNPEGRETLRDLLVPLLLSRRGLSEAELLDISRAQPLTWARVRLNLEDALRERSGFLSLERESLRQAVRRQYLDEPEAETAARRRLVRHFTEAAPPERAMEEVPWQLAALEDWAALGTLLSDIDSLALIWNRDEFEAQGLWQEVERNGCGSPVTAYRAVIDAPLDHPEYLDFLARILQGAGRYDESYRLRVAEEILCRREGDAVGVRNRKLDQALLLYIVGRWDEASAVYDGLETLCRECGDNGLLQKVLLNHSIIVHKRGDPDRALSMLEEQAALCHALHRYDDAGKSLHNQALIWMERGEDERALHLLDEAMDLAQECGDRHGEALVLGTRGLIYARIGATDRARALFEAERRLVEEIGDLRPLPICLVNLAVLERRPEDQTPLLDQARLIAESQGDLRDLQVALTHLAEAHMRLGQSKLARKEAEESVALARKLGNADDLCGALGTYGGVLAARGEWDSAIAALQEARQIARRMTKRPQLLAILGELEPLLIEHGSAEEKLELLEELDAGIREMTASLVNEPSAEGGPDGSR